MRDSYNAFYADDLVIWEIGNIEAYLTAFKCRNDISTINKLASCKVEDTHSVLCICQRISIDKALSGIIEGHMKRNVIT